MRGPIFGAAVLLVLWACSAAGQGELLLDTGSTLSLESLS